MTQFTKEDLLSKIEALDLDESIRSELVSEVQSASEVTPELISSIKDKIQKALDDAFAAVGVTDDESDPMYKKKFNEMIEEIDSAEKDYNKEMTAINKEADKIKVTASDQLDDLQKQAAKDKINSI